MIERQIEKKWRKIESEYKNRETREIKGCEKKRRREKKEKA